MLLMGLAWMPLALATGHWWLLALGSLLAGLLCAPTLTALSDELTRITPAPVRGLAMGVQGSAITLGAALGAPLAWTVVDHDPPGWGFVAVGGTGVLIAAVALAVQHLRGRRWTRTRHVIGTAAPVAAVHEIPGEISAVTGVANASAIADAATVEDGPSTEGGTTAETR